MSCEHSTFHHTEYFLAQQSIRSKCWYDWALECGAETSNHLLQVLES